MASERGVPCDADDDIDATTLNLGKVSLVMLPTILALPLAVFPGIKRGRLGRRFR